MDLVACYLQLSLLTTHVLLTQSKGSRYSARGQQPTSRCDMGSRRYLAAGPRRACSYLSCKNYGYQEQNCPAGTRVDTKFLKKGRNKIAQRMFPCIRKGPACRNVLNDAVVPVGKKPSLGLKFCGIDLGIGIDTSCSISEENKQLVKSFIVALLSKLKIGFGYVKVAGLTFAEKPKVIQLLDQSNSNQATNYRFKNMDLKADRCRTHTDDALAFFNDIVFKESHGDRPKKKNILIFMSDGSTYHGKNVKNDVYVERTKRIGRELRERGVESFVLGMPTNKNKIVGMEEWIEIGGDSAHVFQLKSFAELSSRIDELILRSCENATMNFWD
ncbi:unnamed protein product [Owenia fusiformis]|uniref:Uncharacterized protein n=1 Tax=Owenia fusiformis TaxID=6347 RepID=A0A8J1TU77_OWEFU|nr:unnamed protein product [Owenia fusiformis]